jgi:hypothetical protein
MEPKIKTIPFQPSTIETIDYAVYDWLNDVMNLHTTTNTGWKKIDVIWMTAERAFQTKKSRDRRSSSGTVTMPLIMLERKAISKDPTRKGTAYGNVPHTNDAKGGASTITIARQINQEKTSNFANMSALSKRGQINFPRKNKKIVYNTMSIPMPVYIDVEYRILIKTNYQQQANELLQPFITKPGGINYQLIKKDGHRFEVFIDQNFASEGNASELGTSEQIYETYISLKVLAYLIGGDKNDDQPKIVIRENAVEVKFPRERIIFADTPEHDTLQGYLGVESFTKKN